MDAVSLCWLDSKGAGGGVREMTMEEGLFRFQRLERRPLTDF